MSENPLPPEQDPLVELLDFEVASLTDEELTARLDKMHAVVNDPRGVTRLLTGRKSGTKKKADSKVNTIVAGLLGDL